MKKKKILIIEIIVLIVFGAILVVSLAKKSDESSADNTVLAVEEEKVECIELETPFATLKFQEDYTDRIRMEIVEGDIYIVEFYGTLESKEEIHLSDIAFGGDEGNIVGFLTVGEETVSVNMIYHDQDGEWTEDELIEIQDMQRAVEFVMDELVEENGFLD